MDSPQNTEAPVGKSLRTRIMVANALCAVAESEVHGDEWKHALHTIGTVRDLIRQITLLISESGPLPASMIRESRELAVELETRIQAIEAAIEPRGQQ